MDYNVKMKEIKDIGSIINDVVKDLNIESRLKTSKIFSHWKEIVGDEISKRTKPERISRNTLYVSVASSTWANELNMISARLIERINSFVGEDAVKRIKFRQNL